VVTISVWTNGRTNERANETAGQPENIMSLPTLSGGKCIKTLPRVPTKFAELTTLSNEESNKMVIAITISFQQYAHHDPKMHLQSKLSIQRCQFTMCCNYL